MIEFLDAAPAGPQRFDLPGATVWMSGHAKGRDDHVRRAGSRRADRRFRLPDGSTGSTGTYCLVVSGEDGAFAAVDTGPQLPAGLGAIPPTGVAVNPLRAGHGDPSEPRSRADGRRMCWLRLRIVRLHHRKRDAVPKRHPVGPRRIPLGRPKRDRRSGEYHRWEPWCNRKPMPTPTALAQRLSTH